MATFNKAKFYDQHELDHQKNYSSDEIGNKKVFLESAPEAKILGEFVEKPAEAKVLSEVAEAPEEAASEEPKPVKKSKKAKADEA